MLRWVLLKKHHTLWLAQLSLLYFLEIPYNYTRSTTLLSSVKALSALNLITSSFSVVFVSSDEWPCWYCWQHILNTCLSLHIAWWAMDIALKGFAMVIHKERWTLARGIDLLNNLLIKVSKSICVNLMQRLGRFPVSKKNLQSCTVGIRNLFVFCSLNQLLVGSSSLSWCAIWTWITSIYTWWINRFMYMFREQSNSTLFTFE